MKNWWLKPYTIPGLKVIGKSLMIVLVLLVIISFVKPELVEMLFPGVFYVFYCHNKYNSKSLTANIDFHKMHVPFVELRAAVIKDTLLRAFSLVLASSLCLSLVLFLRKEGSDGDQQTLTFIMYIISLGVSFAHYFRLSGNSLQSRNYKMWSPGKFAPLKNFLFYSCAYMLGMLALVIGEMIDFYSYFLIFIGGSGILLAYSLFIYRAVFHQEKPQGTLGTLLTYNLKGLGASALVFALFSLSTRAFIQVQNLPAQARYVFFSSAGPFAAQLDIETAKEFLTLAGPLEAGLVLAKTPGLGQIPVHELYPKPQVGDYLNFVRYADVSKENIIYMLQQLQAGKVKGQFTKEAEVVIARQWPQNEKFPEHLLAHKIETKRVKRVPASNPQN